jgi:Domain of unknown function (DUF1918)
MLAKPGDRLRVQGNHVGQPDRCGEIVEVRGENGQPPFLVRWDDTDHAVLFFPGSDAQVEHLHHAGG